MIVSGHPQLTILPFCYHKKMSKIQLYDFLYDKLVIHLYIYIFKVEPVPYEELEGHGNSKGVLADMGQFVKSSIDKGVQAIKDLVTPESPAEEFYATPEPYAYGILFPQHLFPF